MAFLTMEAATTKIPQTGEIELERVTGAWTRVPALVFPQCSLVCFGTIPSADIDCQRQGRPLGS